MLHRDTLQTPVYHMVPCASLRLPCRCPCPSRASSLHPPGANRTQAGRSELHASVRTRKRRRPMRQSAFSTSPQRIGRAFKSLVPAPPERASRAVADRVVGCLLAGGPQQPAPQPGDVLRPGGERSAAGVGGTGEETERAQEGLPGGAAAVEEPAPAEEDGGGEGDVGSGERVGTAGTQGGEGGLRGHVEERSKQRT